MANKPAKAQETGVMNKLSDKKNSLINPLLLKEIVIVKNETFSPLKDKAKRKI